MSVNSSSPQMLKMAVLELIGECRQHLKDGAIVDMSEVERGIRSYCTAVASLPLEEGRGHTDDLNMLMEQVNGLSHDMVEARNVLRGELEALERLKLANTAYKKSDAIAGKHKKPEGEE